MYCAVKKAEIARDIAAVILSKGPRVVVEPFCGRGNVTLALLDLDPAVEVFCSDYNSLLIDLLRERGVSYRERLHLAHRPYWDVIIPVEATIYCDPPCEGAFHQTGWDFYDHDRFFKWASRQQNDCYISEQEAPFKCIWQKEYTVRGVTKTERIFLNH